jgi:hypothetical protein
MTVRIYIRHNVTDYAAWRKTYDAFDAKRRKMGVTGQAVYRSIDDENDVTCTISQMLRKPRPSLHHQT